MNPIAVSLYVSNPSNSPSVAFTSRNHPGREAGARVSDIDALEGQLAPSLVEREPAKPCKGQTVAIGVSLAIQGPSRMSSGFSPFCQSQL